MATEVEQQVPFSEMSEADRTNLFFSFSSLLLLDAGLDVSADNLTKLVSSSKVNVGAGLLKFGFGNAVTKVGGAEELDGFLKVGGGCGGGAGKARAHDS